MSQIVKSDGTLLLSAMALIELGVARVTHVAMPDEVVFDDLDMYPDGQPFWRYDSVHLSLPIDVAEMHEMRLCVTFGMRLRVGEP